MCDTKPCDNCCHEEDLICCMPLVHCCGGYSEHNNCCPHNRCCNSCCGGCGCDDGCPFTPECCCCKAMKCCKENKKKIEEIEGDINNINGEIIRLEEKHDSDISRIEQNIVELAQNEQDDINELWANAIVNVAYNSGTKYITYKTRNGSPINVVKVAPLDNSNKIPAEYLPSYVDDVIEGYYYNKAFYQDAAHTTPITGEHGKIYVDLTSGGNNTYRYVDNQVGYIEVSPTKFGKSAGTAYEGNNGLALENAVSSKYTKPGTGIPKSDLASDVQTLLEDIPGKADKSNTTAGTYTKVTVNSQGIVTSGSNPNTLSGYGITDAKISGSTITLGSNSVTVPDVSGKADTSDAIGKITFDRTTGDLKFYSIASPNSNPKYTINLLWKEVNDDLTYTSGTSKSVTAGGFYDNTVS